MATGDIFISYRRDDAMGHAGRLFDRLVQRFGESHVFRDVDTLTAGEDFADAIRERIARSDVVLVVIGKRWLNAADEQGKRRLLNQRDFVRIEVATALERRSTKVVPVLVQEAQMPDADELPGDLASLALRHAVELRDSSFDRDVGELVQRLGTPWNRWWAGSVGRWLAASAAGILLVAGTWRIARTSQTDSESNAAVAEPRPVDTPAAAEPDTAAPEQPPPKAAPSSAPPQSTRKQKSVDAAPSPMEARKTLASLHVPFTSAALVDAAKRGDEDAAKLLLLAGIPPDDVALDVDLEDGIPNATPLLAAAFAGRANVASLLLAKGAKPTRTVDDWSPLHLAASSGHIAVLSALLKYPFPQADLEAARKAAARGGHADAVALLEKHGASKHDADCQGAFAALAVYSGRIGSTDAKQAAMLQHFLDAGCTANARDESGTGLLTAAAYNASNADAIKLLLARGADIDQRDRDQQATALWWVAGIGDPKIAKLLIDSGADPNAAARDGTTPRHRAYNDSRVDAMVALFQPPEPLKAAR
jgi:ankyrin repeat protein